MKNNVYLSEGEIVTAMTALNDKVKLLDQSGETSEGVKEERKKAEFLRCKLKAI